MPDTETARYAVDSGGCLPIRVEVDPSGRLRITGHDHEDLDGSRWSWRLKPEESQQIARAIQGQAEVDGG